MGDNFVRTGTFHCQTVVADVVADVAVTVAD